jgi:hypothetical protein
MRNASGESSDPCVADQGRSSLRRGRLDGIALAYLLRSDIALAMTFHVFRARVPAWREYLRA